MIEGECFCGAIKYRVEGGLANARCCHCSRCRRVFGGASSAYAELASGSRFQWVAGEDQLRRYTSQQDFGIGFCGICGSTLCGFFKGSVHGVSLGTVNGDPGVDIGAHIFVGSKARWDHIGGSAPQFEESGSP